MLIHGDDFRHNREVDAGVFLQHGRRLYPLPDSAEKYAGQTVTAHGSIRSGKVTLTEVAAAGSSTGSTGTMTASSPVSGAKRVAVILINFSDNAAQPFTPASVAQTYFAGGSSDRSVSNYYKEVSWGQVQVSGQAFGWYTIPASAQTCDTGTWANQADAAATAAGVDLSTFDYKTYVFPGTGACPWGGLGQLPGGRNWINGNPTMGIMAHELGHNFGMNHASSATCTLDNGNRVAYGPNCTTSEYGDPYDVMGTSGFGYHVNDWHRAMLGFTSDMQIVSADGTYTLSAAETQSGTPHALRIPRGDGTYFDLELREPYGIFDNFSASSSVANGVLIRKVSSYASANKPVLLDTTPQTSSFLDAALTTGRTFADPTTGISVTTLSVSTGGAQVAIRAVPGGDFTPPSVSFANLTDGGSVTLPADVTVNATDNVGIAKVQLYRNGALYGTSTAAPYTFPWPDGKTGPYTLSAVAYDASGIVSVTPTISVAATQSDGVAPTMPSGQRSIDNTQTSVSAVWDASSDNVGVVGYDLYVNGVYVTRTTDTSYLFDGLSCNGSYAMAIQAVDLAGNHSVGQRLDAWTNACSGDTQSPSMPTGVAASSTSSTSVAISWQAASDDTGVTGYRIDRNGVTVGRTASPKFTDTTASPGATYGYSVTAYDAAGNLSGTSKPVAVTMPAGDTQAPSAPTGVSAVAGLSTVSVSWLPATDNVAVSGYRLYRNGVQVATTAQTSFNDSGVASGTTYSYTVVAFDSSGNTSAASDPAVAVTSASDATAPTAPASLQAALGKGRKVNLGWSPASDNVGVVGYVIYRDGTAVSTVGTLGYTDSPGRGTHTYYVIALDAAGNRSTASNNVTVKT